MTPKTPEELAASKVTSTTGAKTLDVNDFLKLLAVQMNSQDPLNPTQNTEFVAQMANFTSLQQMNNLSTTMTNFTTQQTALTAQNYLGRNVTVLDADQGGSVSGVVTGITLTNGSPMIMVNGKSYDPKSVQSVQQAAASPSSAATPTP